MIAPESGENMSNRQLSTEEKKALVNEPESDKRAKDYVPGGNTLSPLASLQQQVGNCAVRRLLDQQSSEGPIDLDDETVDRINQARRAGRPLERTFQETVSRIMGHDFSDIQIHTSTEADELSRQLGAKAFTTGQDIFFRQDTYNPHSSSGQELITHELAHVVQQASGVVGGAGSKMKVNPPGDFFEQEADAIAKAVTSPGTGAEVQRQPIPEDEEEPIQMQELDEGETAQLQPLEEEDEAVQVQVEEDEVEPIQVQTEAEEEEVLE
jgi:hypothetical protein